MMESSELKQHIVETYDLLPGQVQVDGGFKWEISLYRANRRILIVSISYDNMSTDYRITAASTPYGVVSSDEVIKLLQVARDIIVSGILNDR